MACHWNDFENWFFPVLWSKRNLLRKIKNRLKNKKLFDLETRSKLEYLQLNVLDPSASTVSDRFTFKTVKIKLSRKEKHASNIFKSLQFDIRYVGIDLKLPSCYNIRAFKSLYKTYIKRKYLLLQTQLFESLENCSVGWFNVTLN